MNNEPMNDHDRFDLFAATALGGILAGYNDSVDFTAENYRSIAADAWLAARMMLAERNSALMALGADLRDRDQ